MSFYIFRTRSLDKEHYSEVERIYGDAFPLEVGKFFVMYLPSIEIGSQTYLILMLFIGMVRFKKRQG